jgi:hypothetical protein
MIFMVFPSVLERLVAFNRVRPRYRKVAFRSKLYRGTADHPVTNSRPAHDHNANALVKTGLFLQTPTSTCVDLHRFDVVPLSTSWTELPGLLTEPSPDELQVIPTPKICHNGRNRGRF